MLRIRNLLQSSLLKRGVVEWVVGGRVGMGGLSGVVASPSGVWVRLRVVCLRSLFAFIAVVHSGL